MPSIAFAAPVLPGKTEADREAIASVASGDRRADHEASRTRAGITRVERADLKEFRLGAA